MPATAKATLSLPNGWASRRSPARLYEQERMGAGAPDALGMYVRRWVSWTRAGVLATVSWKVSIKRRFWAKSPFE